MDSFASGELVGRVVILLLMGYVAYKILKKIIKWFRQNPYKTS